jgi:uncharacterized protein DUF3501
MQPLTADDLLPFDEYVARRAEFVEAHRRYCDQYRRVRVGPGAMFVFENRQTLWFRIQEILRVARMTEPEWIKRELGEINRLLPRRNHLQASLVLAEGGPWRELTGDKIKLLIESAAVPAKLITCRPEDRAAGSAHWLEFEFPPAQRKAFAKLSRSARIEMEVGDYRHSSDDLSEDVRQSLIDDLSMSDHDAA